MAIEEKAENDAEFDKKLVELMKNISSNTTTITITGDHNQVFQGISNSEINVTKIARQINQGNGSTYNENK